MSPEHTFLFMYLYHKLDNLGVCEVDWDEFWKFNKGTIKEEEIDLDEFVADCNNDGRERMHTIDRGTKLWFSSTLLFRHAKEETGLRTFSSSERDAAILRSISEREEMRKWLLYQLEYKDHRVQITNEALNKCWNHRHASNTMREFMETIARKLGYKILKGSNSPSTIKQSYGCICQYCGDQFREDQLQIDHIHRKSSNHKDIEKPFNKVPACEDCNNDKGEQNVVVWLKQKEYEVMPSIENAVKLWERRLPKEYKQKAKEKLYTWQQVLDWISRNPGTTTGDYECVNPEDQVEDRKWKRK